MADKSDKQKVNAFDKKSETQNVFECRVFVVDNMLSLSHDPKLVKEPWVFHLYSDGKITKQSGGKKYGKNSEIVVEEGLQNNDVCVIFGEQIKHTDSLSFPMSASDKKYAILTKDNALNIRRQIRKFIESSVHCMREKRIG